MTARGRAERGRPQGHPARGDRPAEGLFPGARSQAFLAGPYLDLVRDALHSDGARARGLFNPTEVDRLLAEPNGYLTPLRGNPLWQLGLLELWLAHHVDGVATR